MPKLRSRAQSTGKTQTLQIRLRPAEKRLIAQAARIRKTTVSSFLLENARSAAEEVLADRVQFGLPPERWQAFCKALDAPPRTLPRLKKLLTEPGVFDAASPSPAR